LLFEWAGYGGNDAVFGIGMSPPSVASFIGNRQVWSCRKISLSVDRGGE
jgi:hypothetical protein